MSNGVTTRFWHLGRRATFRALCKRYGLPYYVVWRRYTAGDRGTRLVRPLESKFGHRGRWSDADAIEPTSQNPHPRVTRPLVIGPTVTT